MEIIDSDDMSSQITIGLRHSSISNYVYIRCPKQHVRIHEKSSYLLKIAHYFRRISVKKINNLFSLLVFLHTKTQNIIIYKTTLIKTIDNCEQF